MSVNFFSWIRDGVKQSVLLGVSDAIERLVRQKTSDDAPVSLPCSIGKSASASSQGGSTLPRMTKTGRTSCKKQKATRTIPSRTSTSSLPVSRRQVEGVDPLRLAELERLQFSCELHDGLLQYLVGAKLATEALRGQLQASHITAFSSQLAAIEQMLSKGIREGREWIGN